VRLLPEVLEENRMSLSCECGEWDDADWYYDNTSDYKPLDTKRRRRCCSCKSMINIGALCVESMRFRNPGYDTIEEKIFGEDGQIWLASHYLCETCADLYFSLEALGYCVSPGEDQRELVKEYADMKVTEARQKSHVSV
jgi:hypothetical protein